MLLLLLLLLLLLVLVIMHLIYHAGGRLVVHVEIGEAVGGRGHGAAAPPSADAACRDRSRCHTADRAWWT